MGIGRSKYGRGRIGMGDGDEDGGKSSIGRKRGKKREVKEVETTMKRRIREELKKR